MSTKDDKKKIPSFPEPFEFLNEELAPHFKRFQELEAMRKAIERSYIKPRELKLTFPPPDTHKLGPSNNPYKNGFMVEVEQKKLDSYLTQRVNRIIKDFDLKPDLSKQFREILIENKYPNPFEDKSPEAIKFYSKHYKDIETSAQFLLDQRRRFKENDQKKESKITLVEKPEVNLEVANKNAQEAKSRFFKSLNYSKEKEAAVGKVYDFGKNKDLTLERE